MAAANSAIPAVRSVRLCGTRRMSPASLNGAGSCAVPISSATCRSDSCAAALCRLGRGVGWLARQGDGEPGALAEGAVDRDRAAMKLDDRLAQRQAEAGPLVAARQTAVDLAEGGKRDRDVGGGHADAAIGDLDYPGAVRRGSGAYRDRAAGLGKLHRIRQQVEQHLAQLRGIAP